jgi:PAS domain S-box-containing protein
MHTNILENEYFKQALHNQSTFSITDKKGNIIFAGTNFCNLFGYMEKELIGQNHSILSSGKQDKSYYNKLWKTILNGDIWCDEIIDKKKNGDLFWLEITITPLFNKSNIIEYFLGTYNNITTTKKLLKKSQKRAYLHNISSILSQESLNIETDTASFIRESIGITTGALNMNTGAFIEVNEKENTFAIIGESGYNNTKTRETLSFTPSSSNIINTILSNSAPVEIIDINNEKNIQIPDFILQKEAVSAIFFRTDPINSPTSFLAYSSNERHIFDPIEKSFIKLISNLITSFVEKKIYHNEIIKEKEASQHYLDIVEEIIISLNKNGEIILANRKAAKTLGHSQNKLLGMNWFDNFIPNNNRKEIKNHFITFFEKDNTKTLPKNLSDYTNLIITKNKNKRLIKWKNTRVFDNDTTISILSSGEDITQLEKAKKEQDLLKEQLYQAKKMESLGLLASGIAHDFNNILASISGFSELATEKYASNKNEQLYTYLNEISEACGRGKDIINQMTHFKQEKKGILHPVILRTIVENNINMLGPVIPSEIKIKTNINKDMPAIKANPASLNQAILNVIINAKEAIENNGTIRINIDKFNTHELQCASCLDIITGTYINLSVQDTGHGISDEFIDKIFNLHSSTKQNTSTEPNHGTGLSTVHKAVHDAGGHILVDTSNSGTTFNILLKIATGSSSPINNMADIKPVTQTTNETINTNKHIMVVDDENSIAAFLGELLSHCEFKVSTFTDPTKALKSFINAPDTYDLVLTDQTMPIITGAELAEKMLALRPDLPVVLHTGHSDLIDEKQAAQMNIRGFLRKPSETHILLKCITDLLEDV